MSDSAQNVPVSKFQMPRPSHVTIQGYYDLSSADLAGLVARALDRMGIATSIPSSVLAPVQPGRMLVGPAITVRNLPIQATPYHAWQEQLPTLLSERQAFFSAEVGDVVVIDGTSVYPASCLGSMSLKIAGHLGVAGVIVAGAVTGLPGIRNADIPVWSKSGTTLTGHQRVETIEINGPVGIYGVRLNPGDLVVADDSGVTFVPQPLIEQALEEARSLHQKGRAVRELLASDGDREAIRTELARFMELLSLL